MAWTQSFIVDNTSKAVRHVKLVADSATYTCETGLQVINHYTVGWKSLTSLANVTIAINSNASGVATNGSVGLSGVSSGAEIYLTVLGR
jgi:hypothetical protein